jgi:hypothetical protein
MSKNIIVRGIKFKIYPTVADADHEELGLYQNLDGTQEIRWSEAPIVGATQTWKSGILCQIGSLERNLNTDGGGSQEDYSGLSIVVANGNKLILRLKELGIILNGKTAELWEFEGTDADADATSAVTQFVGTASYEINSTWDQRFWNIEIKNNRYRRNAFIGTIINNDPVNGNYQDAEDCVNGKIVPITCGEFKIEADGRINPAKFLRTAGKQATISNSGLKDSTGKYFTPEDQVSFPIVSHTWGVTTASSNHIVVDAFPSEFSIGDHIKIYSGFSDGGDKEILDIDGEDITVSGNMANSSGFTYIELLHKDGELNSPTRVYTIKMGLSYVGSWNPLYGYADSTQDFIESLVGKWLKVSEGGSANTASMAGRYRKITSFFLNLAYADPIITVKLSSVFEENLAGLSTVNATNQAWVSFIDIPFEYRADIWPCFGFLYENGDLADNPKKLYVYKSDNSFLERKDYSVDDDGKLINTSSIYPIGFKEIAPYGYQADTSGDKNAVIIDALHFENSPENLVSFDIFPLTGLALFTEANLSKWGYALFAHKADGLYEGAGALIYNTSHTQTLFPNGDTAAAYDRDDTSYETHSFTFAISGLSKGVHLKMMFEAGIDFTKINHEYDAYAIGINAESHVGDGGDGYSNSPLRIKYRKFVGDSVDVLSSILGDKYLDEGQEAAYGGRVRDLSDFYYTVRTLDSNKDFFFSPTQASQMRIISGYTNFIIPNVSTVDQLKAIYKLGFLFSMENSADKLVLTSSVKFTELALICKITGSISEKFYTLFSGRIFNDSWGGRKDNSTDAMIDPIDFIEHFARLQWGGDFGDVVEYGKAYSAHMPIKTGTDTNHDNGSFDSTILDDVRDFSPSWQILNKEDAYTDVQIGNLCKTFDVCAYTDLSGNICITTLDKTNPTETIDFTDIVGKIGWTQEPKINRIYVQPYFNYGYNYGSEKYDRIMGVLNVQAESYNVAYTPGIDNTQYLLDPEETTTDGEYVWNACRTLYLKYGQIERCPASFSDQKLLVKYEDALKVFYKKIVGQGRLRQSFNISYNKGRYYHPGKHVKIKLPHQTGNLSVEVLIERVRISGYGDPVELDVLLLEDIPTAFFFE